MSTTVLHPLRQTAASHLGAWGQRLFVSFIFRVVAFCLLLVRHLPLGGVLIERALLCLPRTSPPSAPQELFDVATSERTRKKTRNYEFVYTEKSQRDDKNVFLPKVSQFIAAINAPSVHLRKCFWLSCNKFLQFMCTCHSAHIKSKICH